MAEGPAQAEEVELNEVADGFVVYHPERDRVHYLNHTAALVMEFCTGENSPERIADMVQACYELPEPPTEEVLECLENLRSEGLIT